MSVKDIVFSETQKTQRYPLLAQLASLFLYSSLDGMKLEIAEFFKTLLEPESESSFIDAFHSQILPTFIEYIMEGKDEGTIFRVLEIIILFAGTNRIKIIQLLIRSNTLKQLAALLFSKSKALKLSILKLLKALLFNSEEINQYFIRHNLLAPLFTIIKKKRGNLLTSACFDMLNVIIVQDIQTLILHIMEKYKEFIEDDKYKANPIIQKLRDKYCLIQIVKNKSQGILTVYS